MLKVFLNPAALFEAANRAAADAIRWSHDANGNPMVVLRRRDADALRALARSMLEKGQ